jgi:hypothetical protein
VRAGARDAKGEGNARADDAADQERLQNRSQARTGR